MISSQSGNGMGIGRLTRGPAPHVSGVTYVRGWTLWWCFVGQSPIARCPSARHWEFLVIDTRCGLRRLCRFADGNSFCFDDFAEFSNVMCMRRFDESLVLAQMELH
jgi:hypothetical protein